jgi:hypothetical protein
MKRATKQKLPAGWNEKKVRSVIAHYDKQTDEEAAAEIHSAEEATGETWISVPTDLVAQVIRLIDTHRNPKPRHRRRPKQTAKA